MRWHVGADRRFGAQQLWMTRIVAVRDRGVSPVHHHAESEAALYGLGGRGAFFFGPDLREWVEVGEGDFLFIPAWAIHAEAAISDEPFECVMARSTPSPTSVNLTGMAVPDDILEQAGLVPRGAASG